MRAKSEGERQVEKEEEKKKGEESEDKENRLEARNSAHSSFLFFFSLQRSVIRGDCTGLQSLLVARLFHLLSSLIRSNVTWQFFLSCLLLSFPSFIFIIYLSSMLCMSFVCCFTVFFCG